MVEMDVVRNIYGTPGLSVHETPRDWKDPPPEESRNEPEFKLVDNPGGCSSF